MQQTHQKQTLKSRVIHTDMVSWRDFHFIQQDDFKELPTDARNRLRASILANDFTQPFYVWKEPGTGHLYCLDGKHRISILEELAAEEYDIPDKLPATFMHCADKQDAARLVLIYSSMYARITEAGLAEFAAMYELPMDLIIPTLDLPQIDLNTFLGETGRDFSALNQELDTESFKDQVVLKLTYSQADYIKVKQRIHELLALQSVDKAEDLILKLLTDAA